MPQYFAMRGTVSRVEVRPAPSGINETGPWVNVYFRESTELCLANCYFASRRACNAL
jgi:hypothetical protein